MVMAVQKATRNAIPEIIVLRQLPLYPKNDMPVRAGPTGGGRAPFDEGTPAGAILREQNECVNMRCTQINENATPDEPKI